ncbi:MAG: 7,8-didemethyl-8-hydroxy-5-deazariboflavin synthase subunit CofG [Promethearchaeota archaeon]
MIPNTSKISPPEATTVSQIVEFLYRNNSAEIDLWKKSAQSIAINAYEHHITFTTNVFIPLTFLCSNVCDYCGFHRSKVLPGQEFLKPERVERILSLAQNQGVSEVLITMGEKPEKKHSVAKKWLTKHGFESTTDYTHFIAEKALKYDLLPHINAGTLTLDELRHLREVSASIGLMLETISIRLTQAGLPHFRSPDKHPKKRIKTITSAGELKIPFTSGILIGIGETLEEIVESLFALKNIHQKHQHIQEVIIQNFQPHKNSIMANYSPPSLDLMEKILIVARHILPPDVSIQIPPNLVQNYEDRFIKAGMSDWGGISAITHDYINPDHKWPSISKLEEVTKQAGYSLRERLPVYPRFINTEWLSERVHELARIKNQKIRMAVEQ